MTLRRTLVAVQLAVLTAGLAVFGVVTYRLYRHAELQRATRSLDSTTPQLVATLCRLPRAGCAAGGSGPATPPEGGGGGAGAGFGGGSGPGRGQGEQTALTCGGSIVGGGPIFGLPTGSYAALRSPGGRVLAVLAVAVSRPGCPAPRIPARLVPGAPAFVVDGRGGPFLVRATRSTGPGDTMGGAPAGGTGGGSTGGGSTGAGGTGAGGGVPPAGDTVVTAITISGVTSSLRDLLTLELAVGAGLLILLAGVSLLVVRRSLRPLQRMAATATAIAGGDLGRRAPDGGGRGEVGQLGGAFNRMLASIEEAFAGRDATERRLRQFLADASHELRTPLTSIRGYAELWRLSGRQVTGAGGDGEAGGSVERDGGWEAEGRAPIDAATAMARIEEHAARMSGMIEELLLLARLDEARPPARKPVDLAVLGAEACDDAVAIDPGRPVRLDAPQPVVVMGDPAHLRRAVANLTVNAVRHTPARTPLEVRVAAAGDTGELVVRDHGPGLPPEALQHAFDRFWQADASRHTGGSGLGLAIVAAVAAEHGGSATAHNPLGGGAAFTLRLPLHPGGAGPSAT